MIDRYNTIVIYLVFFIYDLTWSDERDIIVLKLYTIDRNLLIKIKFSRQVRSIRRHSRRNQTSATATVAVITAECRSQKLPVDRNPIVDDSARETS